MERITVLGIGNILMGDEGVGVHAVRALRENYSFPEQIGLIDGGSMGLDLLPFLEKTTKLLIIDAISSGTPAGTIQVYEGEVIPAILSRKTSAHEIGVKDLLFALKFMDKAPEEICLVGVEPENLDILLALSEKVKEVFPALISAVIVRLERWGVKLSERPRQPCVIEQKS
jgi:hydrogenase maturation protease